MIKEIPSSTTASSDHDTAKWATGPEDMTVDMSDNIMGIDASMNRVLIQDKYLTKGEVEHLCRTLNDRDPKKNGIQYLHLETIRTMDTMYHLLCKGICTSTCQEVFIDGLNCPMKRNKLSSKSGLE